MKELYKSYGLLNLDTRDGWEAYADGKYYRIKTVSIDQDVNPLIFRFQADEAPNWETFDYAAKYDAINCGREPGHVFYRRKWYNPQKIIMASKDYNWRAHITY